VKRVRFNLHAALVVSAAERPTHARAHAQWTVLEEKSVKTVL
jgi:hypothetical protein